jgi:hypothetical protein
MGVCGDIRSFDVVSVSPVIGLARPSFGRTDVAHSGGNDNDLPEIRERGVRKEHPKGRNVHLTPNSCAQAFIRDRSKSGLLVARCASKRYMGRTDSYLCIPGNKCLLPTDNGDDPPCPDTKA